MIRLFSSSSLSSLSSLDISCTLHPYWIKCSLEMTAFNDSCILSLGKRRRERLIFLFLLLLHASWRHFILIVLFFLRIYLHSSSTRTQAIETLNIQVEKLPLRPLKSIFTLALKMMRQTSWHTSLSVDEAKGKCVCVSVFVWRTQWMNGYTSLYEKNGKQIHMFLPFSLSHACRMRERKQYIMVRVIHGSLKHKANQ